jgi:hypothetical protein
LDQLRKEATPTKEGLYWANAKIYNKKTGPSDTGASNHYWGDCGATAMAILNLQVFYRYGSLADAL